MIFETLLFLSIRHIINDHLELAWVPCFTFLQAKILDFEYLSLLVSKLTLKWSVYGNHFTRD